MPVMLNLIKLTLFEFIILIFRCLLCIEEAHKRTVSNERYNTLCLIVPELQTTNPYEDDKDGYTYQMNTCTLQRCCGIKNEI